jgi:hypothetical protein
MTMNFRHRDFRMSIRAVIVAIAVVAAGVVAAILVVPLARDRNQNASMGREWAGLLKRHPAFSAKLPGYPVDVNFQYAAPTDNNLKKLRDTYDLDTVVGRGSETGRIIKLTCWVYQLTGHADNPQFPKELNALRLIHLAKVEHMQINCFMKTIILNEAFLAMGFSSRWTHFLPHSREEDESHFITSVYSPALGKWILMDPDCGYYVTDEKGSILGVSEIRSRLIAGEPLVVKGVDDADRSGFAKAWEKIRYLIEGKDYLWFLKEFIFKIECAQVSMFDQRSRPNRVYFQLIPDGYREELLQKSKIDERGNKFVYINDEGLFWQKPAGRSD